MGTVIEFDYTDEKTPTAGGCPTCGKTFLTLNDDYAAPTSYAEAWGPPVICRGNAVWSWCKLTGDLTFVASRRVVFFPDRRKAPRG